MHAFVSFFLCRIDETLIDSMNSKHTIVTETGIAYWNWLKLETFLLLLLLLEIPPMLLLKALFLFNIFGAYLFIVLLNCHDTV